MISHKAVQKSVELLKKAADHVKIILFGSYARGDITRIVTLIFSSSRKRLKLAGWRWRVAAIGRDTVHKRYRARGCESRVIGYRHP